MKFCKDRLSRLYEGSEILPGPEGLFGVHTSKREFFTLSAKLGYAGKARKVDSRLFPTDAIL